MMHSNVYKIFFLLLMLTGAVAQADEALVPRIIIAMVDGAKGDASNSLLGNMAEMPLNHLGLSLEFHDVNQPLPDISKREDVRGLITWFLSGTKMKDAEAYIAWASAAVDAGKKYVILGYPGFYLDNDGKAISNITINRFLRKLGLTRSNRWINITPEVTYSIHTPSLFVSSEPYHWYKPSFEIMESIEHNATVHLVAHKEQPAGGDSVLIETNKYGGYIAETYMYRVSAGEDDEIRQWIIDPFLFFRLAFATDDIPKPDTTTLAGRRIFYSHIDGDGWNSLVTLEDYKHVPTIAAQALFDKIIQPHPEIPVTVTAIAADLDPAWLGLPESGKAAQALFRLPQVEVGTHTYTHPFKWSFFEDNDPEKERPYLSHYHYGGWDKNKMNALSGLVTGGHSHQAAKGEKLSPDEFVPRAYANERFDIHKEIEGSVALLSNYLPPEKKVSVITWSGDCRPFEMALRLAREAGLKNINGGDTRFDADHPSYASVAPVGRMVGDEHQIYASASNENTYTSLWTAKFHAFQYLPATFERTESPIRVEPMNIYYHVYSAEKTASLNAVLSNIDYANKHSVVPITAGHFSDIAQGFYSTRLYKVGDASWRVRGRGALQTIRFDNAVQQSIDFTSSKGVIGQRHFQGSLYVYLDQEVEEPLITLKVEHHTDEGLNENHPYLVESRWPISHFNEKKDGFRFVASGYGKGEMVWHIKGDEPWVLQLPNGVTQTLKPEKGLLRMTVNDVAYRPSSFALTKVMP